MWGGVELRNAGGSNLPKLTSKLPYTNVKPDVSIATPVRWTVSSTYQLMNEDLPAEWLPTISTVIFSRGGSSS